MNNLCEPAIEYMTAVNNTVLYSWGFPGGSVVKNLPACQCRRHRCDTWSERSPEEENGNPLQYSCLENSVGGGTWQATVQGVTKESNMT